MAGFGQPATRKTIENCVKGAERMRGKCKTCRYHVFEKIDKGYVCVNPDSENVTEWTDDELMCDKYEPEIEQDGWATWGEED